MSLRTCREENSIVLTPSILVTSFGAYGILDEGNRRWPALPITAPGLRQPVARFACVSVPKVGGFSCFLV